MDMATGAALGSAFAAGTAVFFAWKQDKNTQLQLQNMQLQNRNMELQTQKMQTQVNLDLYDKRFKIYRSTIGLIDSVLNISLPQHDPATGDFSLKIGDCLSVFRMASAERVFLLDDDLQKYIASIETKISEYNTFVALNPPPVPGMETSCWFNKINDEKNKIMLLGDDVRKRFSKYLDF